MSNKKNILAIDLGTYCDNSIMLTFLKKIENNCNIFYITDENNKNVPSTYVKSTYKTPEFMIKDINNPAADPSENFIFWLLSNPYNAYESYNLIKIIREKIVTITAKYDIDQIFFLYPAIMIIFELPNEIINKIKINILYQAPAFPNFYIPWIFDSKIKHQSYKIFQNDISNFDSGILFLKRLIYFKTISIDEILNVYKKINHIICWDDNIFPKIIRPVIAESNAKYIGSIITSGEKGEIPEKIKEIIVKYKNIIFISFGSFQISNIVFNFIIKNLEKYCENKNVHAIFHNGNYNSKFITSYKGYIPYGSFIPLCSLAFFSGSICLQNVCLYNKVPLIYVPILTEQYFWAKNYEYQTSIPYITEETMKNIDLNRLLSNIFNTKSTEYKNIIKFLKKVSKSMINNENKNKIENLIK